MALGSAKRRGVHFQSLDEMAESKRRCDQKQIQKVNPNIMLGSSGTGTFEPLNLMYSEQLLGDNESQMKVSQSLQLNSQRRSQDEALCLQEAQKLQAQATELFGQNKEQEEKKEESEDSEEDDGAKLEFQLV